MNLADVREELGGGSAGSAQGDGRSGRKVPKAARYARRGARSGAFAGISGGVTLLRGLRSFRRGDYARGAGRLLLGGALIAAALAQRRSRGGGSSDGGSIGGGAGSDVDQTDVVHTSPDIEDVASESGAGDREHATGEEAAAVVDTSVDIEEAEPSPELDDDIDAESVDQTDVVDTGLDEETLESAADAAYRRLGEVAFDEHSREVPVPQRLFNQELLALDAEAFWGVREEDGAVVVSQLYDSIEDRDGVRYVASSLIDEERMLLIPDEVVDHWDDLGDGGGVSSGDELVFATADGLQEAGLALVVPEQRADETLGAEE